MPELDAIRDAWDKSTGDGRDEDAARNLADQYVAANPGEFAELAKLSLEECVQAVEVFRNANMADSQWRVETWLLHKFEPQNIGGAAAPTVRIV
jgi:hypothetical protein